MTLTEALRMWWALLVEEQAGRPPHGARVRGVAATGARLWAETPEAETVYRQAARAWERETGRCAADGVPGCRCREEG